MPCPNQRTRCGSSKKLNATKSKTSKARITKARQKERDELAVQFDTALKAALDSEEITQDKELVAYLKAMTIPESPLMQLKVKAKVSRHKNSPLVPMLFT